jgi:hypothetical protein
MIKKILIKILDEVNIILNEIKLLMELKWKSNSEFHKRNCNLN